MLEQPDRRAAGEDADVARERELQAGAERVAAHRRDRRNGAVSSQEYASCVRRIPSTVGSVVRRRRLGGVAAVDRVRAPPVNTDVSMPDENARPSPITTSARRSGVVAQLLAERAHLVPHRDA